jgi:hypothetical protein
MSDEFKAIIDASYNNGTPIWLYTSDYIFGMVPVDSSGARWTEVSYTFDDPEQPLLKTERNADLSYQFLLEEVEKGLSFYIKDLNVLLLKEFAKTLEGKSGPDQINTLISELINNSSKYSSNLPIIRSKEELETIKSKV